MDGKRKARSQCFTGPVFLVGMPRSGTKLLRVLLGQHPRAGMLHSETNFLPYLVGKWDQFGDLSKYPNFCKFHRTVMAFPYFIYRQREGTLIPKRTWFELCKTYDPAGVFEALIRHDAKVEFGSAKIWGDKSPSYIAHLPLLKELFPDARFIHITRDVRDYCLSINKAWGKNIIRAAQRWADSIDKIREDSRKFPQDYFEVKYEHLIEDPEHWIRRICTFLDIEFDDEMLNLSRPIENRGDTKGMIGIIKDNKGKYLERMKPSTCRRVETIAASALRSCGYPVNYSGVTKRIPKSLMTFYQFLDALNLVKSKMKEMGFIGAIKFHLGSFLVSRNRRIDVK